MSSEVRGGEDGTREALAAALRSHAGAPCEFLLVTNSIRIRFDIWESPRGRAYLWIDPPWRLLKGDAVSTGSGDCPAEGGTDSEEDYRTRWRRWIAHFQALDQPSL